MEVAESGENAQAEAQAGSRKIEGGARSVILLLSPVGKIGMIQSVLSQSSRQIGQSSSSGLSLSARQ